MEHKALIYKASGLMHSFDVYYCQKTDKVSIICKSFHGVLNSDDIMEI